VQGARGHTANAKGKMKVKRTIGRAGSLQQHPDASFSFKQKAINVGWVGAGHISVCASRNKDIEGRALYLHIY
jgi:hypothetical protein